MDGWDDPLRPFKSHEDDLHLVGLLNPFLFYHLLTTTGTSHKGWFVETVMSEVIF